jgi:hypothetical protein
MSKSYGEVASDGAFFLYKLEMGMPLDTPKADLTLEHKIKFADWHSAFHNGVRWAIQFRSFQRINEGQSDEAISALVNASYLPDGP